ncbi:MAG TPA: peptide chain release factor N(5)-glutamine methyltransferase [Cyclobacteriaceae bacterium]|nr:peptide chain release factor N(5)-glutamine methyltransferase [Cyclobacteriaceae bacterium]
MAKSKELFRELVNKIQLAESKEEIESIVYFLLESQLGLTRTDVLTKKELENADAPDWGEIISRINRQEPIQYIVGEAVFYGRKFKVDPSVLIPRPETELIIDEIRKDHSHEKKGLAVLDVGTGSGCIAITLAKELPKAKIYATDVSAGALMTAVENAKRNRAAVEFIRHNILSDEFQLKGIDIVVSNPPYVTVAEKTSMKKNVTDYEPPEALFVPDDDPFIFYSAIARVGKKILRPGGKVIVEINERFGMEVSEVFLKEGFSSVLVMKDFAGKDRVVSAVLAPSI